MPEQDDYEFPPTLIPGFVPREKPAAASAPAPLRAAETALDSDADVVTGVVLEIIFKNRPDVWSPANVRALVDGRRTLVRAVGRWAGFPEGSNVKLYGRWANHPRYGRQFQFDRIELQQSTGRFEMEAFLAQRIPQVGSTRARLIVDRFGDETAEVINSNPQALLEIKGITEERLEAIIEAWRLYKEELEIGQKLEKWKLGPGLREAAITTWRRLAPQVLEDDVFRLYYDIEDTDFAEVDKARFAGGLDDGDPRRLRAGITWVLRDRVESEGHTWAARQFAMTLISEKLGVPHSAVLAAWGLALEKGLIAERLLPGEDEPCVYLGGTDLKEGLLAADIAKRVLESVGSTIIEAELLDACGLTIEKVHAEEHRQQAAYSKALASIPPRLPSPSRLPPGVADEPRAATAAAALVPGASILDESQLTESQHTAVDMMLSERFSILTGGPGVGKSATLGVLVKKAKGRGETVLLCAPTGKAAMRMMQVIGSAASTVHRALAYMPESHEWLHCRANKLPFDLIVVDESSMLDTALASRVLDAARSAARVVFVGDANQLPSIGAGRVLGDLIAAGKVPFVELTEVHRSAADSWICRNAPIIKDGLMPSLETARDFGFWPVSTTDELREAALDAAKGIFKTHGVRPLVITPRRKEVGGSVEDLNPLLQEAMNPHGERTGLRLGPVDEARIGDVIICRKNNYDLGVFNGETGVVESVIPKVPYLKESEEQLVARFDGREASTAIAKRDLSSFRLGYAITAHAAQGSESAWIVVLCHSAHGRLLSRQLFYTAITRAKKGLIVVGDRAGIERAVANNLPTFRRTGLVQRINKALG